MQRFVMVLAMAGLLPAASLAQRDGGYGGYGRGGYQYSAGSALRDLERIASHSRVDRHERNHFNHAIDDLARFEDRARRGHFDDDKLGNAIGHMEHLADARQIHPRDRQVIRGHLSRLYSLLRGGHRGRW